jgi:hypothetical protein
LSADPLFKSITITPKEVMDDLLDQETREWFVEEACTRACKFDTFSNRFYSNLATIAFAMDDQMTLISSEEFGGLFKDAEAIININNPDGDELYVIKDDIDQIVIIKPDIGMSVFELGRKLEYLMRGAKKFAQLHQKPVDFNEEEEEEKEVIDTEGVYMPPIDDFFRIKLRSAQLLFDDLNEYHSRYYERKELLNILVKKNEDLSGNIDIDDIEYPNIIEYFRGWNIKPEEIQKTFNNVEWIEDITTEITAVDLFDTNIRMRWMVGGTLHQNMRKFLYGEMISENNPKVLNIIFPRWRDKIVVTVDNLILILNRLGDDTPSNIIGKIVFIDKKGNPYLRNLKGEYTKIHGRVELRLFNNTKFECHGMTFIKKKIEQIINK